jgi:hypothetical protein
VGETPWKFDSSRPHHSPDRPVPACFVTAIARSALPGPAGRSSTRCRRETCTDRIPGIPVRGHRLRAPSRATPTPRDCRGRIRARWPSACPAPAWNGPLAPAGSPLCPPPCVPPVPAPMAKWDKIRSTSRLLKASEIAFGSSAVTGPSPEPCAASAALVASIAVASLHVAPTAPRRQHSGRVMPEGEERWRGAPSRKLPLPCTLPRRRR